MIHTASRAVPQNRDARFNVTIYAVVILFQLQRLFSVATPLIALVTDLVITWSNYVLKQDYHVIVMYYPSLKKLCTSRLALFQFYLRLERDASN